MIHAENSPQLQLLECRADRLGFARRMSGRHLGLDRGSTWLGCIRSLGRLRLRRGSGNLGRVYWLRRSITGLYGRKILLRFETGLGGLIIGPFVLHRDKRRGFLHGGRGGHGGRFHHLPTSLFGKPVHLKCTASMIVGGLESMGCDGRFGLCLGLRLRSASTERGGLALRPTFGDPAAITAISFGSADLLEGRLMHCGERRCLLGGLRRIV